MFAAPSRSASTRREIQSEFHGLKSRMDGTSPFRPYVSTIAAILGQKYDTYNSIEKPALPTVH